VRDGEGITGSGRAEARWWVEARRRGSHRVLVKDDLQRVWAYHDGVDLGGPALARVAKSFGYTVDELRRL
jgi:predicted RNA binding protein YcfA (HicA-like mRNA interferase family)